MIQHLAPRCISIVSRGPSEPCKTDVELDSVLSADVCVQSTGGARLVLRLAPGQHCVAGEYADIAEAWRDHARLCLLAGIDRTRCQPLPRLSALAAAHAHARHGGFAALRRWFGIGRLTAAN